MAQMMTSVSLHLHSRAVISAIQSSKNMRHHRGQIHQRMAMQYDILQSRGVETRGERLALVDLVAYNVIALDCAKNFVCVYDLLFIDV